MASYDSRDFEELDLAGRFPRREDIAGVDQWIRLIAGIRDHLPRAETIEASVAIAREFDRFLQTVFTLKPAVGTARVFVSHQRADLKEAERVAWQATEVDFDYWLDVHDPTLAFANRSTIPAPIRAVLIAAIIEMGLLNSTHVVALQTTNSRRSRWVPYEFGRAKQRLVASWNAASWFEKGIAPDPGGDYLSLAFCAPTEAALEYWFTGQPGARRGITNMRWKRPYTPKPLPN